MTDFRQDDFESELPGVVPLFPLTGVLLLPSARLPLVIFEPRYLNLVRDVLEGERMIGLVQPKAPATDPIPEGVEVYSTGCLGRIGEHSELKDGRMLLTLAGVSRFTIVKEIEGARGYRRARVSYDAFPDDLDGSEPIYMDRARLLDALGAFLELNEMGTDWDALKNASDATIINAMAMVCPFEPGEKQALLECRDVGDRGALLISLMEMDALGGADQNTSTRH